MLLCTMIVLTPWRWAMVALVLFLIGTEIRVRTEDKLLAGRFGEAFEDYRKSVPAYLPFVR
jgi:protein-S-isoprenylcysteine O-methyltransferase Ste14